MILWERNVVLIKELPPRTFCKKLNKILYYLTNIEFKSKKLNF